MVREVGVHLEEVVEVKGVGQALLERGDHGRAPSALLVALEEIHLAREGGHHLPHRAGRAVGAAVVGHPYVHLVTQGDGEQLADQGTDVFPLVVGGDHHQDLLGRGAYGDGAPPEWKRRLYQLS